MMGPSINSAWARLQSAGLAHHVASIEETQGDRLALRLALPLPDNATPFRVYRLAGLVVADHRRIKLKPKRRQRQQQTTTKGGDSKHAA